MTPKFHEDSDIYCLACATARPLYADFTEQMSRLPNRRPFPTTPLRTYATSSEAKKSVSAKKHGEARAKWPNMAVDIRDRA